MRPENKMAVMPMPRLLLNMAFPLSASLFVQGLYNVVDSIYVARISQDALTSISLGYPVQIIICSVGIGTAVGLNALMSRLLGEKDYEGVKETAATGLILSILTSFVFILFGLFGANSLARLYTDNEVIAEGCATYLRVCLVFSTGVCVQVMAMRFLQSTGKNFLSMISLLIGACTNIIWDPILIFGLFGFPSLKIQGAAIATVMGQWFGALAALLLNWRFNRNVPISFKGYRLRWAVIKEIYRVGIPSMLTQSLEGFVTVCMNMILAPLSASAVAFYGIFIKMRGFLFTLVIGLGQACLSITAFNLGYGDKRRIQKLFKIAIPTGMVIALIGTIVFWTVPEKLLALFSATGEMYGIGIQALRILAFSFVANAVIHIVGYSISGLGNGKVNMVSNIIQQIIVLIPLTYIFSRLQGIPLVWHATWISDSIAMLYCLYGLKKEYVKKVKEYRR